MQVVEKVRLKRFHSCAFIRLFGMSEAYEEIDEERSDA